MLLPTASTCSPSITFSTLHTVDEEGLKKFNECLKEAFKYYHYGYGESSTLIIDEQPSSSCDIENINYSEYFSWINEDISPSTIRESSSCDVISISDDDETGEKRMQVEQDQNDQYYQERHNNTQSPSTTYKYINTTVEDFQYQRRRRPRN